MRTGKRLPRRETTIAIQFKRAPHPPFAEAAAEELRPNVLIVHVQPDEGVSLAIAAKVPGLGMKLRTVHMDFVYGGAFQAEMPEAYERLILDAMRGDATLFTRADEVDEQWAIVDAIVAAWKRDRPAFPNYAAGTWGPPSADELLQPRRPLLAAPLSLVAEVEAQLAELREMEGTAGSPDLRTSVMTHIAWVPPEWHDAARRTLEGLAERHPSRAILLFPEPKREDALETTVSMRCFTMPGASTRVLRGDRAPARRQARAGAGQHRGAAAHRRPPDLRALARPAAVRSPELEELVDVADRLVVDSREWDDPAAYPELARLFDRIAVSDIAWGRTARGAAGSRSSGPRSARSSGWP